MEFYNRTSRVSAFFLSFIFMNIPNLHAAPTNFNQDLINQVISKSNRMTFDKADLHKSFRGDFYKHPVMIHYLSLAAYYNQDLKSSDGKLAITHLKHVIEYVLSNVGNSITLRGGLTGWQEHHFAATLALAKHTPKLWASIPNDTKLRAELLMKLGSIMGNYLNIDNDYYHTIDFPGIPTGYAPNQTQPQVAWMTYAYYFFGGAARVNDNLINFDFDSDINQARKYKWKNIVKLWTSNDRIKQTMMYGGNFGLKRVINKTDSPYKGRGLRIPFRLGGRSLIGSDPACPRASEDDSVIPYHPVAIFEKSEFNYNLSGLVVDKQCRGNRYFNYRTNLNQDPEKFSCTDSKGNTINVRDVYGHLMDPSNSSPHLGKIGMFYEYNMLERSSPHYVGFAARSSLFHYATIVAMGDLKPKDGRYQNFSQRLRIALDVLYHRDQFGWFDTWKKKCAINRALTNNNGEPWIVDLDKVILRKYPDLPNYAPTF